MGKPANNLRNLLGTTYDATQGRLRDIRQFLFSDYSLDIKDRPKIRAPKGSGPIPGLETDVEFPGVREVDRPGFDEDVKFPGYKH